MSNETCAVCGQEGCGSVMVNDSAKARAEHTPPFPPYEPCSCEEALALRAEARAVAGLLAGVLAGDATARADARTWLLERARQQAAGTTDSAGPAEDEALAHVLADPAEPPVELPSDEDPELVCTERGPCRFHTECPDALEQKCPGYCSVGECRDAIGCEEGDGYCHAHAAEWHAEQAGIGGAL